jgi:hypothetical protein
VRLGGGGADDHAGGDLVVAEAPANEGHDLALALGELLEDVVSLTVGWRARTAVKTCSS